MIAVSWEGYESLVMPKCAFVSENDPQVNMLRFYIGLEDAHPLIMNLDQNLNFL